MLHMCVGNFCRQVCLTAYLSYGRAVLDGSHQQQTLHSAELDQRVACMAMLLSYTAAHVCESSVLCCWCCLYGGLRAQRTEDTTAQLVGQSKLINHPHAASHCPNVITVQMTTATQQGWMAGRIQALLSDKRRHTYIWGKLLHCSVVKEICHLLTTRREISWFSCCCRLQEAHKQECGRQQCVGALVLGV
jgi:hypothetical protein